MASQLLNQSHLGQVSHGRSRDTVLPVPDTPQLGAFTLSGAAITASLAFALAWLIHWTRGNGTSIAGKGRILVFLVIVLILSVVAYAHIRRQWLQYLRKESLVEVSNYVTTAQGLDSAIGGALTLVQEVELVSRGYRMYAFITVRTLEIANSKTEASLSLQ